MIHPPRRVDMIPAMSEQSSEQRGAEPDGASPPASSETRAANPPIQPGERERAEFRGEAIAVRSIIGGGLMGLANIVPGISGGTMLLATGIYPQFISAVAEVSTFRFRRTSIMVLLCVAGAAIAAIAGFAKLFGEAVVDHRWVMYSVFIGLTLGGVPLIYRMVRPAGAMVYFFALIGLLAMTALTFMLPGADSGDEAGRAYLMLLLAGLVAGSAMILPGLSGSYLLLILGQYIVIVTTISAAVDAVRNLNLRELIDAMHVFVPVGIGAVVGVVGVSNLVKLLLVKFERATLGFLLGLLLGAVIGLWPFQEPVRPEVGDVIKGVVLETEVMIEEIPPSEYPEAFFTPTPAQVAGSIILILVGFGISAGIARLGRDRSGNSVPSS